MTIMSSFVDLESLSQKGIKKRHKNKGERIGERTTGDRKYDDVQKIIEDPKNKGESRERTVFFCDLDLSSLSILVSKSDSLLIVLLVSLVGR